MDIKSSDVIEYILYDILPENVTTRDLNSKVSCNNKYKYVLKFKKLIRTLKEYDKLHKNIDSFMEDAQFYVKKMDENIKEEIINHILHKIENEKKILEQYSNTINNLKKVKNA